MFAKVRREAAAKLRELGLPTLKHENWKYTNLSFLNKHNFGIKSSLNDESRFCSLVRDNSFNNLNVNLIVFINGFYSSEYSHIIDYNSFYFNNINNSINTLPDDLGAIIQLNGNTKTNFFDTLNTTLFTDGVYINIPDDSDISAPVHILYINDTSDFPAISATKNIIRVGRNSRLCIIETFATSGDNPLLINPVTNLIAEDNSKIEYNKLQNSGDKCYNINFVHVEQKTFSSFTSNIVSLGGNLIRNNLHVNIDGSDCTTNLNGFYFSDGNDHIDNYSTIFHSKPGSTSNQLYKGIAGGCSTAVFSGKIVVLKDAQKTNAYQVNRNILLSDSASVNSKPQLEIYADDVKCSHGAATGYLDKEALFYLVSRGISFQQAKALLLNAFAADVIQKLNIDALKEYITAQIEKKLFIKD